MTTHWVQLLVGVSLGFLPPRLLLNSECRHLTFEDMWTKVLRPAQPDQRRRRWWKLPLVWIDPFRGYVVANFLMHAFTAAPKSTYIERLVPTICSGVLLLIVMWIQTKGRVDERESLSPAGFLAGAMVGMLPPTAAGAAIIMGAATAVAMQSYAAGYIVAMATTASVGYLFMGKNMNLVLATIVVGFPMLINWLRGTRMVTPVRC